MNQEREDYIERVAGYLIPAEDKDSRSSMTLDDLYSGSSARIYELIKRAYRRGVRRGASAAYSAAQQITVRSIDQGEQGPIPDEVVFAVNDLLQCSPTFRDYSGTDCDTCVFCREPVEEGYGEHKADCPWIKLARIKLP